MVCFAESLEVYDFTFAQEFNRVAHVGIVNQSKQLIVGGAGFLLWCNHESATSCRKWRKIKSNGVRNAIDFVLKAFQRLLQRGPVYVQIAGTRDVPIEIHWNF